MIDLRFHYITQEIEGTSHEQLAFEACAAGAKVVQLRIKDKPENVIYDAAVKVKRICDQYKAALIINDYMEIALEVGAHGVHLGASDMSHSEARRILGPGKIIGGTAYDTSEATRLLRMNIVDYIGIGAFKPTATKPEISTFLTPGEIVEIAGTRKALNVNIHLIVLGGVSLSDIPRIMQCDVDGIAAASLVNSATDKKAVISEIYSLMDAHRRDLTYRKS